MKCPDIYKTHILHVQSSHVGVVPTVTVMGSHQYFQQKKGH